MLKSSNAGAKRELDDILSEEEKSQGSPPAKTTKSEENSPAVETPSVGLGRDVNGMNLHSDDSVRFTLNGITNDSPSSPNGRYNSTDPLNVSVLSDRTDIESISSFNSPTPGKINGSQINQELQRKIDELTKENRKIKQENVKLCSDVGAETILKDAAIRDVINLQESNEALQEENATVKQRYGALAHENKTNKETLSQVIKTNNVLTKTNNGLSRDKLGLLDTNEALSSQNVILTNKCDQLESSNAILEKNKKESSDRSLIMNYAVSGIISNTMPTIFDEYLGDARKSEGFCKVVAAVKTTCDMDPSGVEEGKEMVKCYKIISDKKERRGRPSASPEEADASQVKSTILDQCTIS